MRSIALISTLTVSPGARMNCIGLVAFEFRARDACALAELGEGVLAGFLRSASQG